jgi:hypothetical protein
MQTAMGMYCRHSNSASFVIADKGEVRSSNYNLIAADLRNVASLEEALKGAGFDPRWAGRPLGSSFHPHLSAGLESYLWLGTQRFGRRSCSIVCIGEPEPLYDAPQNSDNESNCFSSDQGWKLAR